MSVFEQMKKATQNFDRAFLPHPQGNEGVLPKLPNSPFVGRDPAKVVEFARDSWPIADSSVVPLLNEFIALIKTHGSPIQKDVYANIQNHSDLITRLLTKRPLMFMNTHDQYLLRTGYSGAKDFDRIHVEMYQKVPLHEYICYDEMQLSALLGVAVRTHFINSGARGNVGKKGAEGTFVAEGVYTGLVGARFEREGLMEYQHMVIDYDCSPQRGYGLDRTKTLLLDMWAKFYNVQPTPGEFYFPGYFEVQSMTETRRKELGIVQFGSVYFNTRVYIQRMKLSLRPFFADADERAQKMGVKAYTHVVGLGLGVWQLDHSQQQLFVDAVAQVLQETSYPHIGVVDFSYFEASQCGGAVSGTNLPNTDINIVFSRRNPADPLADKTMLLVAMYAWDSNSYPGNEYWIGALSASGDPAAACCSEISFLQNPLINPFIIGELTKFYPRAAAAAASAPARGLAQADSHDQSHPGTHSAHAFLQHDAAHAAHDAAHAAGAGAATAGDLSRSHSHEPSQAHSADAVAVDHAAQQGAHNHDAVPAAHPGTQ